MNEMYHVMLGYAEVHSDMEFIGIQTCSLELRTAVERSYKRKRNNNNYRDQQANDGAYLGWTTSMSQIIREEKEFPVSRQHI